MTSTKSPSNGAAQNQPCVVIDWNENGDFRVYADGNVQVFSQSAHLQNDPLYRFSPGKIPTDWLDQPAGYLGDGSDAEKAARVIAETCKRERSS